MAERKISDSAAILLYPVHVVNQSHHFRLNQTEAKV